VDRLAAAPLLETERLILRGHRSDDLAASFALWCEPLVYHFIAGKPATREETWRGLLRHIGQWQVVGFGFWVATEKSSGRLVGELGYLDCKRDITPSMEDTPELGWALTTQDHGRGYAFEAMSKILQWGDANLSASTTACIINPANGPSLKLAAKLGFRPVAEVTYRDTIEILHHRARQ
jgi:RimJ/RimL family protein N-acetyltransferase